MTREYRFHTAPQPRWVDIDSWGVVNHAVYLSLMEQARYEYFAGLGLLEAGQVPFVMARIEVEYHRPGLMGMQLELLARVSRLGGKSFDMDFEVRAGDDLLVSASTVLVYVDADLKPRIIPDFDRQKITAFEETPPPVPLE